MRLIYGCLLLMFVLDIAAAQEKHIISLRGIKVDLAKKYVEVTGVVNLTAKKEVIELLATAPGGKAHESILVLNCNPALLRAALTLLNLQPGGGGDTLGDPTPPFGDHLYIYVKWQEGEQQKITRAEQLLFDKKNGRVMPFTPWIFTGGRFVRSEETGKMVFAANVTNVLAATFYDPDAIVNNPLPERVDDTVYRPHTELLPKQDTPVIVTFRVNPLE